MGRTLTKTALAAAALSLISIAAPAAASGDAGKGKAVFQAQCAMCHAAAAGKNGIGPSLFGIVGRASATAPKYQYSSAMKGMHLTWTEAQLRAFLPAPANKVRGTKMPYAGLGNPQQLGDLIAYLATIK
jgi:cytochrome c